MIPSQLSAIRRSLRVLRWMWVVAFSVVFGWHMSLLGVDNPEVVRPVILAYAVVCFPVSFGVIVILALLGWASLTDKLEAAPAALLVAGLFFSAGWVQWFRAGPWLSSVSDRFVGRKRTRDQAPD